MLKLAGGRGPIAAGGVKADQAAMHVLGQFVDRQIMAGGAYVIMSV